MVMLPKALMMICSVVFCPGDGCCCHIDGVLNDSRRANVQEFEEPESDEAESSNDEEYPSWIRAQPSSLQAISDRSTTAQV